MTDKMTEETSENFKWYTGRESLTLVRENDIDPSELHLSDEDKEAVPVDGDAVEVKTAE